MSDEPVSLPGPPRGPPAANDNEAAEASWILGFPLQALLTRYVGLERAFPH